MDQVGQTKVFSIAPIPASGTQIYAYVWDYWDGSSEATTVPSSVKRINIGGKPGYGTLIYSCQPVQIDGQSVVLYGTLAVNNPPSIISPVEVSVNDGYFPFNTRVTVRAFDFENEALTFGWYDDLGTYFGVGTSSYIGNVDGTWRGENQTIVGVYNGTQNYFDTTVVADKTLVVLVRDTNGGTSAIGIDLRGRELPPVSLGGSSSTLTTTDGSSVPVVRVEPGAEISFSVYAKDPAGNPITFEWLFNATDGWTTSPTSDPGTSTATEDGGVQNAYVRDVSGETVTGERKTVRARVRITGSAATKELIFDAILVRNLAPSTPTFTAEVNGASYNLVERPPIASGAKVKLVASSSDVEGDVVEYKWEFTQPFAPNPLILWGAEVLIDTTGYTNASTLVATVTAYDRSGAASSSTATPAIPFV